MPRIEGYRFGHVVVDGEEQTRDVIVLPDRVLTGWWRADGHRLVLTDLDDVIEELPWRLTLSSAGSRSTLPTLFRRIYPPSGSYRPLPQGALGGPAEPGTCPQDLSPDRSLADGRPVVVAP
jgi:hypothetical protein